MAANNMVRARTNLVLKNQFFGVLALRLRLVEDEKIPTACTNGYEIRFNPKWVGKLPGKQAEGLLAHEVMHCAFLHHIRKGARNDGKWNAACDFNINDFLIKNGFQLPPEGLLDPKNYPSTMSVDEIYNRLPTKYESPTWGFVIQSPNGTGEEGNESHAQQEADWKQAVAMAAHVARMQGKLPAGISEMIDDLLTPQIPWVDVLRRFVTEPAKDDYSWRRANRRFAPLNLYLPTLYSETVGEIVYAIDTSGSMPTEDLQVAATEADAMHREVKPSKTVVIYCDAAVHRVDEFGPDDQVEFHMCGRGGTDFVPVFEEVEKRQYRPKCLVFFTDGYGTFPDPAPEYPVLWVMTTDITPPFGETIYLSKG